MVFMNFIGKEMPNKIKVDVLEREGVDFFDPEESKSDSDYLAIKGIAFEGSDNYLSHIVGGEIAFQDPINGQRKISDLKNRIEVTSTDPTSNSDSSLGYVVGHIWVNVVSNESFVCVDSTIGAAIWISITASQSGLSESDHKFLDTLLHNINEDSYTEFIYLDNSITDVIIWTNSNKTLKIREENYSYSGNKINQSIITQYDEFGNIKETYTEVYTYSGNKISNISGDYNAI